MSALPETTRLLARFAAGMRHDDLPGEVRREGPRAMMNWIGCVYGGLGAPSVETGFAALAPHCGPGSATVIGRGRRADPAGAAFFNVLASSAHGYDDAHLPTIAHPGPPAAGAALAAGEVADAPGGEILVAMLIGIELQCRLAMALAAGDVRLGFHMTGLTGATGAAAAAGRILGLDAGRMTHALGIAAAQGAGFRETHASMANGLVKAHTTRCGVAAAQLAQAGFTCTESAIEGEKGFLAVFGGREAASVATADLGSRFELLRNACKPYPCAIPINPIIDACLDLAPHLGGARVEALELRVNPVALHLAGRREPASPEQAMNSLYHWAAVALLRRRATLDDGQPAALADPAIADQRRRIAGIGDAAVPREAAQATARLSDGRILKAEIRHARGSAGRPMTDAEIEAKYAAQAARHLAAAEVAMLAAACRDLAAVPALSRSPLAAILPKGVA